MAAGGSTSNLQLGPGRLYVAPLGTAEPTNASTALAIAWIAIGYTEEGSAVTLELTNEAVYVAEEVDAVLYLRTSRTVKLGLAMAEVTRKRFALALGMGTAEPDNAQVLDPPIPGAEVGIMIVWDSNEDPTTPAAGADSNRRWLFRQAKTSGTIEIARRKAPAKALLPVTFDIEKPATAQPFRVFPNAVGKI